MASAEEDLTEKIVVCTESIEGFKEKFPSLLQDLFHSPSSIGPNSNIQVFFHLLSAILTSDDETPINKFYALYLILKVSEGNPTGEFLTELNVQEKLVYEIVKSAQYESGPGLLADKGKTFFSKTPSTSEANIGMNYVRLCIETVLYWGDTFGSSDINDPFHSFWLNKEALVRKISVPHTYLFVGKEYYGNEEVATWNFNKEDLPSIPSQSRIQYQEGKGFVQNLKEGETQIQVIVSQNLNSLSPEKSSMIKNNPNIREIQNTKSELPLERIKKQAAVEDTPNFQESTKILPLSNQNFGTVAQSAGTNLSPVKENPLDKFRKPSSGPDSGRKKVSFHVDDDQSIGSPPKGRSQFSDKVAKTVKDKLEESPVAEPPKREKIETRITLTKKNTLGTRMAEMGLFTDDKKGTTPTGDATKGIHKQETPSSKDLEKNIRNFFVEREKAEIQSKRNSARMMQIPETEFRGPQSPVKASSFGQEASPTQKLETIQDVGSQKEQSPLLLVDKEISNENAYLRSQLQQRQRELERSLQSEEMSRENNLLNEEIERYKDASQMKVNRHDSLVKENAFLKAKMFEFEQKLREMNNKITQLQHENKRLTGTINIMDDGFENPQIKSLNTPSPKSIYFEKDMRASQEVYKQASRASYHGKSPSSIERPQRSSHNLKSTPTENGLPRSMDNVGTGTQAGRKKIFELVNYEKPRMVLTAKDFAM